MLISIIIPTFNRYSVLRSVSSVLEQNLGSDDFEVIILDDCSTTIDHERLSNALESLGNNIQYVQYKSNVGPGKLRNHGISLAKGKYLLFLDSDDFIAPNALRKMIEEAENTDSEVIVTRKTWLNGKDSESISTKRNSSSEAYWNTHAFHSMTPQGKLFTRSLIDGISCRFSETRRWGEDQPFITSAYIASKAVSVLNDQTYVYLGVDDQNLTRASISTEDYFDTFLENVDVIRALEKEKERGDDLIALNFVRTAMRGIVQALESRKMYVERRRQFLHSLRDIDGLALTKYLREDYKKYFVEFLDNFIS